MDVVDLAGIQILASDLIPLPRYVSILLINSVLKKKRKKTTGIITKILVAKVYANANQ